MLKTNIEALRGLYVALGGDVADVADITTLPEMLMQISTVAAAAASELPPVEAADNGDVLTVVNGKWAKAAPAGGDNLFVITRTGNSFDKTASEVKAALESGKTIFLNYDGYYDGWYALSSVIYTSSTNFTLAFVGFTSGDEVCDGAYYEVVVNGNNIQRGGERNGSIFI